MGKIDINKIFEATNDGLDIIEFYYPDAKPGKQFKIRPEKTASASLKQNKEDGRWLVTDWGYDSKPRNAIAIVQQEERLEYGEALDFIAKKYSIPYENGEVIKVEPKFKKYAKKDPNQTGREYFFKDALTDFELKTLGRYVTQEVCSAYNLKSIKYFVIHKENESVEVHSTDDYPIFSFEKKGFRKIYQPLAKDKKLRFSYYGEKPKNEHGKTMEVVWGLDRCKKLYDDLNKDRDPSEDPIFKLDEIIIMSGDRDALNMASLGFPVVWMNSETKQISEFSYNKLKSYAHNIYNVPDIDITGRREGVKLALTYIDMKTLWLPDWLRKYKDFRGNPLKDFRDYISKNSYKSLTKVTYDVKALLRTSYPMQFWKTTYDRNKNKKQIYITEYALNFIKHNQFHRYKQPNLDGGYTYIHIDNNIVTKIPVKQTSIIKNYTLEWLRNGYHDVDVIELIHRNGAKYTDANLSSMPFKEIDFTDASSKHQYYSFKNEIWKISAKNIEVIDPKNAPYYIWEERIIQHPVKKQKAHFKITKSSEGEYDIEILNKNSEVLNYLIQTSRMYWEEELENAFKPSQQAEKEQYFKENKFNIAGSNLSEVQIKDQKKHLINKIYSIGYLLHNHKMSSRPWAVYAMDGRLSEEGKSYGGSGKSILYNMLIPFFTTSDDINGNNKDTFKNQHVWERVNEDVNYVIIDDTHEYFNLRDIYQPLTSNWPVNPKGTSSYVIPFKSSPKIAITSNFPLKVVDGSTERRLLYTIFSDYYHEKGTQDIYKESKRIVDDFNGKQFIDDWNQEQMNTFINFMMQCVQFYLGCPDKMEAPDGRLRKRNLLSAMGANFKEWADVYFIDKLDKELNKMELDKVIIDKVNKNLKAHSITKKLQAWCDFYNYELDPVEMRESSGKRIIKKDSEGKTYQVRYIKSKLNPNKDDEELPF